jgi:hypothetical protein
MTDPRPTNYREDLARALGLDADFGSSIPGMVTLIQSVAALTDAVRQAGGRPDTLQQDLAGLLRDAQAYRGHTKMGMGDGSGDCFVHGPYEAIKRCQEAVLFLEEARPRLASWLKVPPDSDPEAMLDELAQVLVSQAGELGTVEKTLMVFARSGDDTIGTLAEAAAESHRQMQASLQEAENGRVALQKWVDELTQRVADLQTGQQVSLDVEASRLRERQEEEIRGLREELAREREARARLQGYVDRIQEERSPTYRSVGSGPGPR